MPLEILSIQWPCWELESVEKEEKNEKDDTLWSGIGIATANLFLCPNLKYLSLPNCISWTDSSIEKSVMISSWITQGSLLTRFDVPTNISVFGSNAWWVFMFPNSKKHGLSYGNASEKPGSIFAEIYSQCAHSQ